MTNRVIYTKRVKETEEIIDSYTFKTTVDASLQLILHVHLFDLLMTVEQVLTTEYTPLLLSE